MNEVFRGAFGAKLGSDDVKNYAGDDSEVRFKPKPCFRDVLKDVDFSKNTDCLKNKSFKTTLEHMFGLKRTS